jgi:hypothetical protein
MIKGEHIELVHQIFTGFNKTYDSVLRAVLCHILIEFVITMNRKILTKLCLNGNYKNFQVSKNLFSIKNFLKNRDDLSPLLFKFLDYDFRSFRVNHDDLILHFTHNSFVYADDIHIFE